MYIFLRQRKYDSTFIKTTYGLIDLVDCDFDVFCGTFNAVENDDRRWKYKKSSSVWTQIWALDGSCPPDRDRYRD